jgi:hypothetical protein
MNTHLPQRSPNDGPSLWRDQHQTFHHNHHVSSVCARPKVPRGAVDNRKARYAKRTGLSKDKDIKTYYRRLHKPPPEGNLNEDVAVEEAKSRTLELRGFDGRLSRMKVLEMVTGRT